VTALRASDAAGQKRTGLARSVSKCSVDDLDQFRIARWNSHGARITDGRPGARLRASRAWR
jgi:hypothetical protein